ncbi:putative b-zip transcription factor idi-4 protein [Daldinia childiae]|uniref:putative b-zip transcription factor idi-4 protein n=1 Tax=Daldinia childiae TaxID=326645 RepID=UPI001444ABC5|nr:putative b-zip transcription factor idi-4 protein [Daldinia childiae]KAF3071283.1 putative b-zip transcription factor idi-4 protein [Daldinia childiae]
MPESSSGPSQPAAKSQSQSPPVDAVTALKRKRNNAAARKYRQKRIDRISELETELRSVKDERDELRLRLARQEAEAATLRSLLQMNSGKGEKS